MRFLWGFAIGFVIATVLSASLAWSSLALLPLGIGAAIQYKIKQKAKIVPTKDFSKGHGDKRRG